MDFTQLPLGSLPAVWFHLSTLEEVSNMYVSFQMLLNFQLSSPMLVMEVEVIRLECCNSCLSSHINNATANLNTPLIPARTNGVAQSYFCSFPRCKEMETETRREELLLHSLRAGFQLFNTVLRRPACYGCLHFKLTFEAVVTISFWLFAQQLYLCAMPTNSGPFNTFVCTLVCVPM